MEDPVNGDQIKQKENRAIFGISSEYNKKTTVNNNETLWQVGVGFRYDEIKDSELSGTLNRKEMRTQISLGDIFESNLYAYANTEFNFGKFLFNPALRFDYFKFQYNDALTTNYVTQSETKGTISPKLNFLYNYSPKLQLYLKTGKGFHSNDTRVVVAQNGKSILPAAYGADLGFIWKPNARLFLNTALWYLYLEQEFVYVGDAGIVEPSGKS